MTITLRQRKKGKGKIYLYLEIYKGKDVDANGKTKYYQEYEYLNLFLIDKPKTIADKQRNKEILNIANGIKAKKELEYQSGRFGLQTTDHKDTNFLEYYHRRTSKSKHCMRTITSYVGDGRKLKFSEITRDWCSGYLDFLQNKQSVRTDNLLKTGTILRY